MKNSVYYVLWLERKPEMSSLELIFRLFASHTYAGIRYQRYELLANQSEDL